MAQRQRILHLAVVVSVALALSGGPRAALAQPAAAPSAGFVVNVLTDAPDANLGNAVCETATPGQCSLRAALQQANATAGADAITFSVTGIITLTSESPLITDTLTLTGPGPALLVIDADATGSVLQFLGSNPAGSFAVSGVTLTGGSSLSGGGLVYSGATPLVISDTVVSGNAAYYGGGLHLVGDATLVNSLVRANVAVLRGGGIDNSGALTISNSQIQENAQDPAAVLLALAAPEFDVQGVGDNSGGGLFTSGALTMTHSLVLSNTAAAPVAVLAGRAGAAPAAPAGPFGAGLYVHSTLAQVFHSVIAGNHGLACAACPEVLGLEQSPAGGASPFVGFGGGVYAFDSGLLLEDSQLVSNTAQVGGGLYASQANVTLRRTAVADNRAQTAGGLASQTTFLAVQESVLRDNWAAVGGGGALYGAGGNLQLNGSLVLNNYAGGSGGGLYINGADLYIGFTQIEGNASGHPLPVAQGALAEPQITSDQGGGLYLFDSDVQIYNSAVISNSATLGGGIDNASALYMENTSLSGNTADRDGGGLRLSLPPVTVAGGGPTTPTAELLHVTVAGNRADADANGSGDGGGLFVITGTTAVLHSTLLGDNFDGGGASAPECAGGVTSTGYNLIQATTGCTITATTGDQFNVPSGVLPLQANGGPTLSNGLAFDSLARDTADPDFNRCMPQDQRNFQRPFGAGCDIGAFELQVRLYLPLVLR